MFNYTHIMMRGISTSFIHALSMETPSIPIDMNLAKEQHDTYSKLLQSLVPCSIHVLPCFFTVIFSFVSNHIDFEAWEIAKIEQSSFHPDCCFVEDTCEFFHSLDDKNPRYLAVINELGAPSRKGEEIEVENTLKSLTSLFPALQITRIKDGTIDGGDIMFTKFGVMVGLTKRTSQQGFESLKTILNDFGLSATPIVISSGLHLKSFVSMIDEITIVVVSSKEGQEIQQQIEKAYSNVFQFLPVPDLPSCNVLRIGNNVIMQRGYPQSEAILEHFAEKNGLSTFKLEMSEFIKADGALTCCNVLMKLKS